MILWSIGNEIYDQHAGERGLVDVADMDPGALGDEGLGNGAADAIGPCGDQHPQILDLQMSSRFFQYL